MPRDGEEAKDNGHENDSVDEVIDVLECTNRHVMGGLALWVFGVVAGAILTVTFIRNGSTDFQMRCLSMSPQEKIVYKQSPPIEQAKEVTPYDGALEAWKDAMKMLDRAVTPVRALEAAGFSSGLTCFLGGLCYRCFCKKTEVLTLRMNMFPASIVVSCDPLSSRV